MTAADERIGGAGDLSAAIAAAQSGDENAFRQVYRQVQPALLRYVQVLVGTDAEDVTSETWLQIARGFAGFRGGADEFRAWSATIARNRALDHLRHLRRRPITQMPHELLEHIRADHDTAEEALSEVAARRALSMITALPGDQAEAVLLRVVMGLDASSAGRVLGKRAGAVRTAAYRGLRRLGVLLDREAAAAEPTVVAQRDAAHHGVGVTHPADSTLKG